MDPLLSLMESKEQAENFLNGGYLCSQSILMAYAPQFNLERDLASRLAASFGAGLARRGETCGAVIAACMVLGILDWLFFPFRMRTALFIAYPVIMA